MSQINCTRLHLRFQKGEKGQVKCLVCKESFSQDRKLFSICSVSTLARWTQLGLLRLSLWAQGPLGALLKVEGFMIWKAEQGSSFLGRSPASLEQALMKPQHSNMYDKYCVFESLHDFKQGATCNWKASIMVMSSKLLPRLEKLKSNYQILETLPHVVQIKPLMTAFLRRLVHEGAELF